MLLKTSDHARRLEAYCKLFGWQGGTIHQVATETGCDAQDLLMAEYDPHNHEDISGWYAARTCSLEHNKSVNFVKNKGNLHFWLGAVRGMMLKIDGV